MTPQPPKKDRSYDQCNNIGCEVTSGDGRRLQACAGCGIARYCVRPSYFLGHSATCVDTKEKSKVCQKSDWKNHKPACKGHQFARTRLSQPGGTKKEDIYMRVSKWILKHRPSLGDAMVCSFDIPHNPHAQRRQVLEVDAKYLHDQDDERCLVITGIRRGKLDDWVKNMGGQFALAAEQRQSYEEQSVRADPEAYGTGLVFLQVMQEHDLLFMRSLPITFDLEMAGEVVPRKDSEWQDALLRKTGCIPLIQAGLAHTHCEHCNH
ncbi:hypothetical protein EIP91_000994 [Steccherinum ochraceum]|uniref:MYND-type domain-containing protein n=1 Tax=Steccherinum ochraceum TaxID=92696 RepID=A0A4R0RIU8_9APHY|nr:hypothetical protein EIP91_000994 [Steccherinum ochraceum]